MSRRRKDPEPTAVDINPSVLRDWPLPVPPQDGDSESRGRVLVVGGAADMPGTVILAATAALRAGAGSVRIATGYSARMLVMVAIPEARVHALPEDRRGMIVAEAVDQIVSEANQSDALLIGPGLVDWDALAVVLKDVLRSLHRPALVLDAAALAVVSSSPRFIERRAGNVVLIAHPVELARLLRMPIESIRNNPAEYSLHAAEEFGSVVVLKGQRALAASPDGRVYRGQDNSPGLTTRGSADVLAGIIGGLVGRGAEAIQAAVWGIALHSRAGDVLARRHGPIGYLARELLTEIPSLLVELSQERRRAPSSGHSRP